MNFYQKHQVSPPKRRLFSSTSFCCHGLWYTTPLCCLGPWIHLPPNVWHSFKVWIDPCRMLSSRVFLKVTLGSFFPAFLIFKGFHKQHPNFASSIRLQCQSSWVRLISFESCHLWTAKRFFRFRQNALSLGITRWVPVGSQFCWFMNPSEETIYLFVWEASTNFGWFRSGGSSHLLKRYVWAFSILKIKILVICGAFSKHFPHVAWPRGKGASGTRKSPQVEWQNHVNLRGPPRQCHPPPQRNSRPYARIINHFSHQRCWENKTHPLG